jgi:hypothetical protein
MAQQAERDQRVDRKRVAHAAFFLDNRPQQSDVCLPSRKDHHHRVRVAPRGPKPVSLSGERPRPQPIRPAQGLTLQ